MKIKKEGIENVKLVAKGFRTDIQQLDIQIKSLMSMGNTSWKWKNSTKKKYACTVCGKEDYFSNIKRHIELYHIEGVNVSCSVCEKMYKTRLALKNHMQVCNKTWFLPNLSSIVFIAILISIKTALMSHYLWIFWLRFRQ